MASVLLELKGLTYRRVLGTLDSMPKRGLDQELYDALKTYFRAHPGDVHGAARVCGCGWKMARRAYHGPPSLLWPWATPLSQVLSAEEQAAQREQQELEVSRRVELSQAADRQRELESEAQSIEENILRAARNDVLGGLVGFAKLVQGINKLAERVNRSLETGVTLRPDPALPGSFIEVPLDLDPLDAMKMMGRFSLSARALVSAAETVLAMQRLRSNLPTAIVGVEIATATIEEAERELALAEHSVKRAKELGLIVVQGGKAPVDTSDRHVDRTARDRD